MDQNDVYSWMEFVAGVVITMLMVGLGIGLFVKNKQEVSFQNAVYQSVYSARQDNARKYRGVFAVDEDQFKKDLESKDIKGWDGKVDPKFKINFLEDTGTDAQKYNTKNKDTGNPGQPIKAVQVIITAKDPDNKKEEKKRDVVTYIVSTQVHKRDDDISK